MLSIIIPIYNAEEFIDSAIQQILKEGLDSFEIILVDNNSTDHSWRILEAWAARQAEVKIFKESKQGAGVARNKGFKQAVGEFVYFFDVDDVIVRGALVAMLELLRKETLAAAVYGGRKVVQNRKNRPIYKPASWQIHEPPVLGLYWFRNFSQLPGTPAFMHRACILKNSDLFPENAKIGEDAFFHIKLGLKEKIIELSTPVFHYYRHPKSTVTKNNAIKSRTQTYWEQYLNLYIPYYHNKKTIAAFDELLHRKLKGSFLKLILEGKTYGRRKEIQHQLLKQLETTKPFFIFKLLSDILVLTGSVFLYKLIVYYYPFKGFKI